MAITRASINKSSTNVGKRNQNFSVLPVI